MINTRNPSNSASYMDADDDVPLHHLFPDSLEQNEIRVDQDFDIFTYGQKKQPKPFKDSRAPVEPIADYDDSFNYRSNSRLLDDENSAKLSILDVKEDRLVLEYLDDSEQHKTSERDE